MILFADLNQQLPGGLVDDSAEFFIHQNDIKCLYQGKAHSYDEIPSHIMDAVEADMMQHPKALEALAKWGITNAEDQIKQYIFCRFGGFDSNPDISDNGDIHHREYFDCGRRGNCAYEGKLCPSVKVAHGELSKREIEVLRLIGLGRLDKEICDDLGIALDTLRSHKDNIKLKTGEERKTAQGVLAHRLGLI